MCTFSKEHGKGYCPHLTDELPFCGDCARTKMTRSSFPGTRTRAVRPLALVHSDVCGPISPATVNDEKYFVSFVDDFTHMTVIYLMKSKDEVYEKFKLFHRMATSHFCTKLSKVRCDNGGEYRSEKLKKYCEAEGVQIDFVPPYTPELNVVA